jgi:hypothetical protein
MLPKYLLILDGRGHLLDSVHHGQAVSGTGFWVTFYDDEILLSFHVGTVNMTGTIEHITDDFGVKILCVNMHR